MACRENFYPIKRDVIPVKNQYNINVKKLKNVKNAAASIDCVINRTLFYERKKSLCTINKEINQDREIVNWRDRKFVRIRDFGRNLGKNFPDRTPTFTYLQCGFHRRVYRLSIER